MNLSQKYVLDWHDEVGSTEPLHTLLREEIRSRELGQNTYFELDREFAYDDDEDGEDPDGSLKKIFDALDKLVPERPDRIIVLVWW